MDFVSRKAPILLRCLRLALMAAAITGGTGPAISAPRQPLEQAVKASFLFKFAPFVEWPPSAMGPAAKPFSICIIGDDPFGATIDEVVRGQRISGRAVIIRRAALQDDLAGCQILFAGRSGAPALAALAGQPVLTVGDRQTGASGTMIQFVMQNGRVRFQIDEAKAHESGLSISSKLLNLAVAVDRK